MYRLVVVSSVVLLGLVAPVVLRAQGKVEGQILNGTVNQPVQNQEVRLLAPRQGMQQVATASTDVNGRFVMALGGIDPSAFLLLETRFQGVAYHAPAQFDSTGAATVNLTVYESSRSESALRIQSLRILVRTEGAKLRVQEEYDVLNSSEPPRALVNPEGTFRFRLSPGASEPAVAVAGLMNMPLPQTAEPGKSSGEFSIRYPLKPGITGVTVSYEADYTASRFVLGDRVSYPIDGAEVYVSPSSLTVESAVFKPAGIDASNGIQKLEARNLRRDAPLELQVAGEAPAGAPSEAGQTTGEVKVVPNSMTRLGVPLLACFLLVLSWALGVRVAKEWPRWHERRGGGPKQKQLQVKVEALFNSLADLDELFASRKIAEGKYWKERLELKAKLVATLKKAPPSLLESYATRQHTAP